ncbi:sensor histidine kinase [Maribellus sediminis]|uniref:sensor histidine kinase n=1 Tax=Maribellus sediminis TaxID=2696285 RepID=UPI00142F8127|nr:PAS domain-containing sensor histidine kinase [Maribellus sediminis]
MIFLIPVFLYGYYISEFSSHLPPSQTVHFSAWWMIAGLIYLYFFTKEDTKVILFSILSLLTIGGHLYLGDQLRDSFSIYEPFLIHPLFIFLAVFLPTFYLWKRQNTENEKLVEAIQNQNASLNRVLQNSAFMISRIIAERDEDGNIVKLIVDKVNNAFESTFKRNLYEIQGQEADYVFNLIFKGKLDVNKTLLFNRRKTTEFHASNMDKWFKTHAINPGYNLYYLIFEDITTIKQKIAELEANKRRYKVLLEAIPDIFFVIDKDGIYEDFVIKESDLFKMEDANIIGSSIFNAGFPDKMANKIYSCIQSCLKTNSIETIEYSLNTPNGTFLFEMRLAKLNANSVISVARDITKRKTAEFGLEKALKRAEESDRLKSAFLANLSHEIRTPMNIITNFTRMLVDADMNQFERVEITDAITENGKQLINMIDNTIHLSKIETENIEVKHQFGKVNSIIRDIYNAYSPNLPDSKDLRIQLKLEVMNPEFGFSTDIDLLKEALTIIVDNAVKYTPAGVVTIGYEMVRNEYVKFIVTDTGIGIPKDEFENIFSRFYRIPNTINQSTSGSGIGLSIAQHYIALLGGELQFDSKLDKGSEFWFALPFTEGKGYMAVVK